MPSAERPAAGWQSLARLFYHDLAQLGQFASRGEAELPGVYRQLLAHTNHMTVTVERHHGGPVDVEVLATQVHGPHYARKIVLRRQRDAVAVQFGIVRLNLDLVSPAVRQEVESQAAPLGRILIRHGVLLQIRLEQLWEVRAGADLARLLGMRAGETTYGRTAQIECGGEPGVELLEIVAGEPG